MINAFFAHGGYLGIVVFLVICGFGVPVPEEVPVVLAGVLASQGTFEFWPAWLACVIGAIGGDSVMYAMGRFWGTTLLQNHPRFAKILHADREAAFEEALTRHSLKVLFLARFMVGIRAPVYLAAGALRIPYLRFLLMDLFCATIVVSVFFSLAYRYGESFIRLVREAQIGLTITVLLLVVIGLAYFYFRYWRRVTQKFVDRVEQVGQEKSATEGQDDPQARHKKPVAEQKRVG